MALFLQTFAFLATYGLGFSAQLTLNLLALRKIELTFLVQMGEVFLF